MHIRAIHADFTIRIPFELSDRALYNRDSDTLALTLPGRIFTKPDTGGGHLRSVKAISTTP
jgi:hypothetical protein